MSVAIVVAVIVDVVAVAVVAAVAVSETVGFKRAAVAAGPLWPGNRR